MPANGRKTWNILWLMVVVGCETQSPPSNQPVSPKEPAPKASSEAAHSHGSGPHGGTVADWGGGKFHIEFTVDHDIQESTVYVLSGDAKTPAPIKADKLLLSINDPQFQLELLPKPLEGEVEGLSSCFTGTHENLGKVQEFVGTISGEVEGKPYAGDFKEEP